MDTQIPPDNYNDASGTDTVTADWIKRRRELLDAATEAPWKVGDNGVTITHPTGTAISPLIVLSLGEYPSVDDVVNFPLIADARTSLEQAVNALEAVLRITESHWSYQTRRESKLGRTGSSCVCEICETRRIIDKILGEVE